MEYDFDYSRDKDLILRETRQISFKDIIEAYKKGKVLADLETTSKKHPNQRLLVVAIKKYAYVAPYVIDEKKKKIFLKTVYPSRKLTKKFFRKQI